jgi:hypothetical protein
MAFEQRRGNIYYYRKRREGAKVVSDYVGSGEVAYLADHLAKKTREERREARQSVAASDSQADLMLDDFSRSVDAVTDAYLEMLGYHRHKGQWRRRRD